MADVTLRSSYLAGLVAEAARLYFQFERQLTVPTSNIGFTFGDDLLTVNGVIPVTVSGLAASGNASVVVVDQLPDYEPILTVTPLADMTLDSLGEVLLNAVVRLDALEAPLVEDPLFPEGAGTTYSIAANAFTFTSTMPYTAEIDASGRQIITIADYTDI